MVQGPGGDFAEAPVFRFEPATQASESSWIVLPGPLLSVSADAAGVGDEMSPDDVAEAALQCPDGFAWGLALGELAFVVAATRAVVVADLDDRGDVDGVVESSVAAP